MGFSIQNESEKDLGSNVPKEIQDASEAIEIADKGGEAIHPKVVKKATAAKKKQVDNKKKTVSQTKVEKIVADMDRISQKLGRGRVKLGSDASYDLKYFTTGSLMLDIALGGGYPVGRNVEIFGIQSSGKTMMSMHAIRERQAEGEICGFVDLERTMTKDRMIDLGVNTDLLMTVEPEYAEDVIDEIEIMINSGVTLIVVDSVAAMLPKAEAESDTADTQVMIMGRIMSKAMRKLTPLMHKMGCTVIWLNQTRKTITMSKNNDVTTGGNALPFYASQRIKIHRNQSESSQLKDSEGNVSGAQVQFTVVKNKTSSPFEKLVLNISYDGYIDEAKDVVKYVKDQGLIEQEGKIYYVKYNEKKLEVGTRLADLEQMLRSRNIREQVTEMVMEDYIEKKRIRTEIARARYF